MKTMNPVLFFYKKYIFPYDKNLLIAVSEYTKRIVQNFKNQNLVLCWTNKLGEHYSTNKSDYFSVGIIATITNSSFPETIDLVSFERVKITKITEKDGAFFCSFKDLDDHISDEEFQVFKTVVLEKANKIKSEFENLCFSMINCILSDNTYVKKVFEILKYIINASPEGSDYHEVVLDPKISNIIEFILTKLIEKEKIFEINQRITMKTNNQIQKKQMEFFLQEKIKTIKSELGENNTEEEDLVSSIKKADLPEEIYKRAMEEVNKLNSMPAMSLESFSIKNYLKWIINLPWKKEAILNTNIKHSEEVLNKSHYGMENVKEEILEYIAISNRMKKPVNLLLVGAPGVGKSTICEAISKATGRPLVKISMAGLTDNAKLQGHSRTYVGAQPGLFIQKMKLCGVKNPIFQIDEVDKKSDGYRNPEQVLLNILDPSQNNKFEDHYLDLEFDFSNVLFVLTANRIDTIPREILDRVNTIYVDSYSLEEKEKIAEMIIKKEKEELNLSELHFEKQVIKDIINFYTRESGVRELKRKIQKIIRKSLISNEYNITTKNLELYLKKPPYTNDLKEINTIGVVNGLAWTNYGGDVLQVECVSSVGNGKIEMTGNLGTVMKESIHVVFNYIKSQCEKWHIPMEKITKQDFFLHVPEGAIPKEGPSAGVTVLTALYSLLKNQKVNNNIAMTGEISLTGEVHAIGGLKEKLVAAIRNGIDTVYVPKRNSNTELNEDIKNKIKIVYIRNGVELIDLIFSGKIDEISSSN